jgi:hypothetical protein
MIKFDRGNRSQEGSGQFQHLAREMYTNSIRQHEFAVLLRLLSSRVQARSLEWRALRSGATTARSKETKLRTLLSNLGWTYNVPNRPRICFLVWFGLAKWWPVHLTILLLPLAVLKPIRARLLDDVYPWNLNRKPKISNLLPSSRLSHLKRS